jgi:hypothetical protein
MSIIRSAVTTNPKMIFIICLAIDNSSYSLNLFSCNLTLLSSNKKAKPPLKGSPAFDLRQFAFSQFPPKMGFA